MARATHQQRGDGGQAPGPEDKPRNPRSRRRGAGAAAAAPSRAADDDDAEDDPATETTTTTPATSAAALRRAVRLVDYRERSTGELLSRLRELSFPEPDARAAVARLEASGLVDDRRFADLLVARRWRSRAEAPRAIRQALLAAGVPREVGEGALAAFFGGDLRVVRPCGVGEGEEGGGEENENDDGGGDEAARWRALVAAAREQARRSESEPSAEKRRARLGRWLAARGHSWDTVSALAREVGL